VGREQRGRDEASRDQRFVPKLQSDIDRVNAHVVPPSRLVAAVVHIAMVLSAQWHGELVADLTAERSWLGETNVVGFGWPRAAKETRLRRYMPQMLLVANPLRLVEAERALVDSSAGRRTCFRRLRNRRRNRPARPLGPIVTIATSRPARSLGSGWLALDIRRGTWIRPRRYRCNFS
jgi:hypothetical protein